MCMLFAVATDQYTGAELKKALRRDIDDLARNKALQVSHRSSFSTPFAQDPVKSSASLEMKDRIFCKCLSFISILSSCPPASLLLLSSQSLLIQ